MVVDGGAVVLEIDPTGHNNGGVEDQTEDRAVGVEGVVVVVKEDAAAQIEASGSFTGCGDECCVASEAPFGTDLRPVAAASLHLCVDVAFEFEVSFSAGEGGCGIEPVLDFV